MGTHVVIGAGGIGRAATRSLLQAGQQVVVLSRSGPKGLPDGAEGRAVDITDTAALDAAVVGADSIVNAVNPSRYWRWAQEWPVMAASILGAAERSGAGLVTISNLYGYGRVDAPMTEDTAQHPNGTKGEIRVQMWRDALRAHEEGRCRVTELRPADYFGPGAGEGTSLLNTYVIGPAAAGKPVSMPIGGLDVPHSWSYLGDIGALAAALATGDGWGRAWHVPTLPPRTVRQVAAQTCAIAGVPAPKISALPRVVVSVGGWFSPMLRELWETRHQFERPFVLDSTAAQERFGLAPTPWETQMTETIDWLHARS
jgi:nucleoside-diphosphate-sugar epimerase